MPRQARINVPGLFHHVMARGIEGREIFRDESDRENFLARLSAIYGRGESLLPVPEYGALGIVLFTLGTDPRSGECRCPRYQIMRPGP